MLTYIDINYILLSLVKSISVITIFAYLLGLETNFFQNLLQKKEIKNKLLLALLFGFLSLLGTYLGIYIQGAYANIRAIGAVIGGLLGGPIVGLLAGLIGGIHRYYLGGFTAFACALATILAGLSSGIIYRRRPLGKVTIEEGFLLGIAIEIVEMGLVLALSNPYTEAYQLVKLISLPMILSNACGISFFIYILHKSMAKEKKIKALQSYKALKIANQSLNYLQDGLNYESALETAKIILEITDVAAVSITNCQEVLAHCGVGEDHHQPEEEILTQATKEALAEGHLTIVANKEDLGCPVLDCQLKAAVIAPLTKGNEEKVTGALKLYKTEEESINDLDIELAKGIANLLSTQLHISTLRQQAQLATEAELKALQAQIRPHFLFNALNTIMSFCRTNPERARRLLMKLAKLFRKNLQQDCRQITLAKELEFVQHYIDIEQARFGNRLEVEVKVPDRLVDYYLPSFTLQPIVENAIKHGLADKVDQGLIEILALEEEDNMILKVTDNGIGIKQDELKQILTLESSNEQIGISNVDQRIKKLYGLEYGVEIDSQLNQSTTVVITLPQVRKEDTNEQDKNRYC